MTISITVELSEEAYQQLGVAIIARNIIGTLPASVIETFAERFANAVKAGQSSLRIETLRPAAKVSGKRKGT